MVEFLLTLPNGFQSAVELMNKLPIEIIQDMCERTLQFLQGTGLGAYAEDYRVQCESIGIVLGDVFGLTSSGNQQEFHEQKLQNVINLILFIYKFCIFVSFLPFLLILQRNAIQSKTQVAEFPKAIRRNTQIDVEFIKTLTLCYDKAFENLQHLFMDTNNQSPSDKSTPSIPFEISKLKNLDWKLSIGLASHCIQENLYNGTVTLVFTIDSANHEQQRQTIELTLDQFKQLYKEFETIHSLMEFQ